MTYKMQGITIPDWPTIKGYFTQTDQQHMLLQTGGDLDLWDCNSVKAHGQDIYNAVSSGHMPPGNPWPAEWINNFFSWWKQGTCP
jgi:hypothetical protein